MSAADATSLGRARLGFANAAEADELAEMLGKFERGEIGADEWRAYRLVRGNYGQRQAEDAQMLRCKIPQGILTGPQLEALADVAENHSRGFGHITTRQNFQFHFVKARDVAPAMRRLAESGLTTREACGNAVRNITACARAGCAADEAFDITPYAEATTRYLLRHPLSSSLPRKFKIAFEGCVADHALTAINDLGFRAQLRPTAAGSERGFRVTAGGGTAIWCRNAPVLEEFLLAGEILDVAEAVIRVFHRFGDRVHRHRNRLKFLIKQLGWDGFVDEYTKALAAFRADGGAALPFDPAQPPVEEAPVHRRSTAPALSAIAERVVRRPPSGPGLPPRVLPVLNSGPGAYADWKRSNVICQKQPGYSMAIATVVLGDLTAEQLRTIAALAHAHGDGTVRVTPEQNFLFRWVADTDLPRLHAALAATGLGLGGADTVADVLSCPGAESCKLAVTQSRGLGRLLTDHLRARPHLVHAARNLHIKISGCPNGCGLHHLAGVGFQGSLRKIDGRPIPQYFVMVGGGIGPDGAHFARLASKIPARRIPLALERLVALYQAEKLEGEEPAAFFRRVELARVRSLLDDLAQMAPNEATPEDFVDLGEAHAFAPETQEGECMS